MRNTSGHKQETSPAAKDIMREFVPEELAPKIDDEPVKRESVIGSILNGIKERRLEARKEESTKLAGVRRWILRIVAIFASLSCAATSVYFSNKWFVDSQPKIIALIMSLTIVATLTVSPELSISLARKRRYITALFTLVMSLVATVFSMSSTIGGIYNARSEAIEASANEQLDDSATKAQALSLTREYQSIQGSIARVQAELTSERGTVSSYQSAIDKLLTENEDPNSQRMRTLVANRTNALARSRAAANELNTLESRAREILGRVSEAEVTLDLEGRAERDDFNSWLARRFSIPGEVMEFILAAFPAVFIDVIAPVMLVVAFGI
jgi:hypothetical protein